MLGKLYFICCAVAATTADYDRLAYLEDEYVQVKESSDQDLREWELQNLTELYELRYLTGIYESEGDAEQALHNLVVSVSVRGDWRALGSEQFDTSYKIYLQGAIIQGELDVTEKPCSVRLIIQNEDQSLEDLGIQTLLDFANIIFNKEQP